MSVGWEAEAAPVAKAKAKARAKKKSGRPPVAEGPKKHILGIRGSEAYKEWLIRFALARRRDMVDLVDEALEAHAKAIGFEAPPKR